MDKSNSDSAVAVESATSPAGKKAAAKSKAKPKVRSTTSHPPTSEMVMAAIKELKDRKGSSLQAIKKYIVATYKVDGDKLAPFIKRYLKSAVTSGEVVQTKGKGASGSFKLPGSKTEAKPKSPKSPKAAKAPKAAAQKSPKKDKAEKVKASPKKAKTVAEKTEKKKAGKAAIAIKPKATKAAKEKPVQAKAASKTKKTAKAPAAKTKTPKPKRSSTPSRAAAKK